MKKHFYTIFRLWGILKPFHKFLYLQIVLIFIIQLTGTSVTILFSKIIDSLVNKNLHAVYIYVGIFPIVALVAIIVNYIADRNEVKNFDSPIEQHLQEFSFKKIFSLNAFQYIESHSAIKLQVINRGESAVQSIIQTLTLQGLPVLFSIAISFTAISYYSPVIGLWTGVTFISLLYTTNKFNKYFSPLMRKNLDNWDSQRRIRTEAFSHLLLIKLSGQEKGYLKKYLSNRLRIITYSISIWLTNAKYLNTRNFFIYISRFVSLVLVVVLFIKGHTTIGAVYAIFSWTSDVYGNIGRINSIFRQIPLRFVELEKYLNIIDQRPEFDEEKSGSYNSGTIEFKNVFFKYPAGINDVLEDVSFRINEGEKVAFVGASGSGKSTIVRLILRMYEWKSGEIMIGNKNIQNISAEKLRQHIGYVEQHVDLFDDTVKENILFGVTEKNRKTAEKKLEEVALHSRITEFYHRLGEEKFETLIGERGVKLSGGERQRVGIARAIIKDPEILIFDEATSSLDTENEAKVMEAINDVSKGKTTIIIAHRLSTIRDADKIIVMDKGKIVGEGTHDELLESNDVYKNLVEHQIS